MSEAPLEPPQTAESRASPDPKVNRDPEDLLDHRYEPQNVEILAKKRTLYPTDPKLVLGMELLAGRSTNKVV